MVSEVEPYERFWKKYIIIFCLFNNIYSEKIILNNRSLKTKVILELIKSVINFEYKLDENINSIYSQNKIEGDLDQIIKHILFKSCPALKLDKIGNIYDFSERARIHEAQIHYDAIETECINNIKANFNDNFVNTVKQFWNKISYGNKQLLIVNKDSSTIISTGTKSSIKQLKNYIDSISETKERIKIDIIHIVITDETAIAMGINWSGVYNRLRSIELFKNFSFAGTSGLEADIPLSTVFPVINPSSFQTCGNLFVDPGIFTFNLYPADTNIIEIIDFVASQGRALVFPPPNFDLPLVFGGADLNLRRLNLQLNAAENQKLLKVVDKMSVIIDNGETVKIFEGQSVPYYEQVLETLQDSARSTVTYFYRDIGTTLQLKPTIIDDEKINIDIFNEFTSISSGSSFIDFSQYPAGTPVATIPVTLDPINLNWTQMKNQLTLYNDQAAVINSFESLELNQIVIKVPYISKLPIIGKLFTGKYDQAQKNRFATIIIAKIIK